MKLQMTKMNSAFNALNSIPGDSKTQVVASLISARLGRPVRNLLVVGCGSGLEAAVLARDLQCPVTGIDINDSFDPRVRTVVTLEVCDATAMRFADASFDFVYSYHALEHIPDYRKALSEMRRVLRADGSYYVGTPNRARVLGYLGSKTASTQQKIKWNLGDWQARLRGRFRNEYGAHAGFLTEELGSELVRTFGLVTDISVDYYRAVYPTRLSLVNALHTSGLGRYVFPCIYFMGTKATSP